MAHNRNKRAAAGWGPWPFILGLMLVGMVGMIAYRSFNPPPPEAVDPNRQHVEIGQQVNYETDPPTAGPHWGTWVPPGFHKETPAAELLVHNLEHGNIVIYYDVGQLPPADLAKVEELTKRHQGQWDGVLAVPRKDEQNPLILTAWGKMLQLKGWDEAQVGQFVDAYRGRGPENPVR